MKINDVDVKYHVCLKNLDAEHKTIFDFIEKLKDIANQPKYQEYAVIILEEFIVFFVEHTIKEEQLLQQYLPVKLVEEHASLHERELNCLDESLRNLSIELSTSNIQTIAKRLEQEFKKHIYTYDKEIINKLVEIKRTRKAVIDSFRFH